MDKNKVNKCNCENKKKNNDGCIKNNKQCKKTMQNKTMQNKTTNNINKPILNTNSYMVNLGCM
jgi:hypothetical protein